MWYGSLLAECVCVCVRARWLLMWYGSLLAVSVCVFVWDMVTDVVR